MTLLEHITDYLIAAGLGACAGGVVTVAMLGFLGMLGVPF